MEDMETLPMVVKNLKFLFVSFVLLTPAFAFAATYGSGTYGGGRMQDFLRLSLLTRRHLSDKRWLLSTEPLQVSALPAQLLAALHTVPIPVMEQLRLTLRGLRFQPARLPQLFLL